MRFTKQYYMHDQLTVKRMRLYVVALFLAGSLLTQAASVGRNTSYLFLSFCHCLIWRKTRSLRLRDLQVMTCHLKPN